MKAIRIPVFVLAVLLAFSVCNAVHLTRRCALWQAELAEADRAAAMGDTEAAGAALARLEALWQADQAYLHIVVSHEDIHDAETLLRRAALLCDTGNDERPEKAGHGTERGGSIAALERRAEPGAEQHGEGRKEIAEQSG